MTHVFYILDLSVNEPIQQGLSPTIILLLVQYNIDNSMVFQHLVFTKWI
jgi:hypothetical protein